MNNSIPLLEPLFDRSADLSQREIEVLNLIAAGHQSKDAADILFLSKRTVDSHLSRVYNKLRVSNRIQAVSAARELGMLS
ncbi:MAG: helix-turn-helix transcriptional regulator [Fimbriimonadaceae bacterium]